MSKVMVEVGDLKKLKKAIAAYEPWVESGARHKLDLVLAFESTSALVELAKRVVAEEERIQGLIDAPADIDSSF